MEVLHLSARWEDGMISMMQVTGVCIVIYSHSSKLLLIFFLTQLLIMLLDFIERYFYHRAFMFIYTVLSGILGIQQVLFVHRSALQTLHKSSSKAQDAHYFLGGLNHDWVGYYERGVASDQSCINEWNAMDSLESKRPPSPESLTDK